MKDYGIPLAALIISILAFVASRWDGRKKDHQAKYEMLIKTMETRIATLELEVADLKVSLHDCRQERGTLERENLDLLHRLTQERTQRSK